MSVTLNHDWGHLPYWRQIADRVAGQIRSGEIAPGERAPSTAELASVYGVAPGTARMALVWLRQQGLITVHPGKHSVVAEQAPGPAHHVSRTKPGDAVPKDANMAPRPAQQREADHPFVGGSNPLRCLTCGVPKGKHP
jgi:GntR family transcriptional regulator